MSGLRLSIYLISLSSFCFGLSVLFPMYPYSSSNFDAETFSMGDVNLFAGGPSATFLNPANLDTSFIISTGLAYEVRTPKPNSFFGGGEKNVGYYPQSVGLTIPYVGKGSGGILLHSLMKQNASLQNEDTLIMTSNLTNLSLGYHFIVSRKMNFGIGADLAWGQGRFYFKSDDIVTNYEYTTYGLGALISFSLLLNRNSTIVLRLMSPVFLDGKESVEHENTLQTNNIRDNVPWEVNLGVKHDFSPSFTVASQATYRNWSRGQSGFIWGEHEWQLHGGIEFKPLSFFELELGSFVQQFDSDLEIPFLKKGETRILFLTGGIGLKTNSIQAEISIGRSISVEHYDLSFYPVRSLIILNLHILPNELFKKTPRCLKQ